MSCVINLPNINAIISRATVALILEDMDCETTANVGDLVRIDTTTPNKVIVATANDLKEPVIGVIKNKLSATKCNVYLRGIIDRILPQGRLYLSPLGNFTNTPPTADYLQTLGYSFGNGKINLEPNQIVTKIIP